MMIIIVLYDVCWFPIKMYQFLYECDFITYCSETQFRVVIYTYLACHWVAMANSFVNPIVYSFTSQSFRVSCQHVEYNIWQHALKRRHLSFLSEWSKPNHGHVHFQVETTLGPRLGEFHQGWQYLQTWRSSNVLVGRERSMHLLCAKWSATNLRCERIL